MPSGKLDVTTLRRSTSTTKFRVHEAHALDPLDDVVRQPDGLPVTNVARTLVDLAAVLTAHQLERVCHRAEVLRRLDAARVERLLAARRSRGARNLRAVLTTLAPAVPEITRSELEERSWRSSPTAASPEPRSTP